jgi:hypothetical protein
MNKYEERAERERKAAMRSGMTLWSAGLALVVVIFLILGLSSSAPPSFFSKGAIIVAILLLVLRQLSRRLRTKGSPRAARPDPQSTLKLD